MPFMNFKIVNAKNKKMEFKKLLTVHDLGSVPYGSHTVRNVLTIWQCLLAHTDGVSKLRTQSRLRITFSLALPLRNG